jgi:hypothetical protein
MNEELAKTWKEFGERMDELAKVSNGKDIDLNLKPNDVLGSLDAIQNPRKRKSPKWVKIKEGFNNTLTIIEKVGGMVADAASQVSFSTPLPRNKTSLILVRFSLQLVSAITL